jgi:hypothetical protein
MDAAQTGLDRLRRNVFELGAPARRMRGRCNDFAMP